MAGKDYLTRNDYRFALWRPDGVIGLAAAIGNMANVGANGPSDRKSIDEAVECALGTLEHASLEEIALSSELGLLCALKLRSMFDRNRKLLSAEQRSSLVDGLLLSPESLGGKE